MAMNTNTANIYITATDRTREALSSISGNLGKVKGAIASIVAVAGGLAAVNSSLKKFADLNDFGNFGIGTDKALQYIDTLKLAGMEQGNIIKSFEDLSKALANSFNDEKLRFTFNQLGITLDDIKKKKPEEIFDKIQASLGSMEDKTKAIALASQIFGKNGFKIVDASQDEELKAIQDKIKSTATEIKYASAGADEFYKNIDRVKALLTNDLATSFSSILIPVNALLNSFIQVKTSISSAKKEVDILASSDSWSNMIEWGFDFAGSLTAVFGKISDVIGGVLGVIAGGFLKLIPSINLVGDAIFGGIVKTIQGGISSLGDLGKAFKTFVKGDWISAEYYLDNAFKLGKNYEEYKEKINKDRAQMHSANNVINASIDTLFDDININRFDSQKKKYVEAYGKMKKQIQDTVKQDGKGSSGTDGIKDPLGLVGKTDSIIKELETQLNLGKENIAYLMKFNELEYSDNFKTIEDYYQNKKELIKTDFEFQKSIMDKEIEQLNISVSRAIKDDEKAKIQAQLNDLYTKRNKLENDYVLTSKEIESKSNNDILKNKMKELDLEAQLNDLKITSLREDGVSTGAIFENNLKIKSIKEKQIELLNSEIESIKKRTDLSQNEKEVQIGQITAKVKELEKTKDEIANTINEAVGSSFETMFSDILTGTKSVKDAFMDMANNINKSIMNLIAQNLSQQLMESIMPKGGSSGGGIGGFFSSLFGGSFDLGGMLGFRATGGGVNAGNAYVVGERGPELFFPNQSGFVANSSQTQAMAGGGNNIVVNIQASNLDSFRNSEAMIASQLQKALIRGNRVN